MMTGWMIYGGLMMIVAILLFNETVKDEEKYWLKINVGLISMTLIGFVYDSVNEGFYGMYLFILLVALNTSGFMVHLTKKTGRKALIQLLSRWQMRLESR